MEINFGTVSNLPGKDNNNNFKAVVINTWFQVVNNSEGLSGRKSSINVNVAGSAFQLPIQVIGPLVKPHLLVQKSVKVTYTVYVIDLFQGISRKLCLRTIKMVAILQQMFSAASFALSI